MADEQVTIPQHFFRALCQTEGCKTDGRRTLLGGFHIPAAGGIVVFACHACKRTSVFRNEAYGIRAVSAGPLVPADEAAAAATATTQRRR